jgi:hypothetical protein
LRSPEDTPTLSTLHHSPDYKPGPSDLALPPAAGPTMSVALREQLGRKLEPVVAALMVVVIDRPNARRSDSGS